MEFYSLYNGLKIPCIGFGTFPHKEKLEESIPIAVSTGYRLIDTSDNYGNEAFVGSAYRGLPKELQSDTLICTKFSEPCHTPEFSKMFYNSLTRLYEDNTGIIDIYLLHWPYPHLWKDQWKLMEDLYLAGKCKAIGVCNFDKSTLRKLLKKCRVKPMINQLECHPMFWQKDTIEFCQKNDILVMSYSPLARVDDRLIKNQILMELAQKYDKSIEQIILRWNVEHRFVPIPASASETHIKDNINIFDFSLTEEEIRSVDALECGMRIRFDPKRRFAKRDKKDFLITKAIMYKRKIVNKKK